MSSVVTRIPCGPDFYPDFYRDYDPGKELRAEETVPVIPYRPYSCLTPKSVYVRLESDVLK